MQKAPIWSRKKLAQCSEVSRIKVSVPLASSSRRSRSKPPKMRSFCGGGAASVHAVMPGAWLVAQAKLIGILVSANGPEVIGLRHLGQQRERPQQQTVDPHRIKLIDIHVDQRAALVLGQIIGLREGRGRSEIGLAARRLAIDVADQLLQGV